MNIIIAGKNAKVVILQNYFGRTIAVDASMCLYQFLIAVRSEGSFQLTDEQVSKYHIIAHR